LSKHPALGQAGGVQGLRQRTENFLTADYAGIADDIGYPCHEAITFIPPWNFQLGRTYPLASWPIPLSSQIIPLASEAVPVVEEVSEGLVASGFQFFSRLAAVFAEEVGDRDIISLALQFAKTFGEGSRFG